MCFLYKIVNSRNIGPSRNIVVPLLSNCDSDCRILHYKKTAVLLCGCLKQWLIYKGPYWNYIKWPKKRTDKTDITMSETKKYIHSGIKCH